MGCSNDLFWNIRNPGTNTNHNQDYTLFTLAPVQTELETIILGQSRIPSRYDGSPLTLTLASNAVGALFECRFAMGDQFAACPAGAVLSWPLLPHSMSYFAEVRARLGDRVDSSPAQLAFVVDRISGQGLQSLHPSSISEMQPPFPLPKALSPEGEDQKSGNPSRPISPSPRTLALGGMAAVIIPSHLNVVSYSTTHTYSGTIQLVFDPTLAQSMGQCSAPWEMTREILGQTSCVATPTRGQYQSAYVGHRPLDHIEMAASNSSGNIEGLLLAAFEQGTDPSQIADPEGYSCYGARSVGSLWLQGWKGFFGIATTARLMMSYCSMASGNEFIAKTVIPMAAGSSAFLIAWYRVSPPSGVFSWNQLQTRLGDYLNKSLVATMPL